MIKYHVDFDARCVVAFFEGGKIYWTKCLRDMLYNVASKDDQYWDFETIIKSVLANYQSLGGVAKCHPSDIFDEQKGKILAKAKLLARWESVKTQVLRRYKKDLNRRVATIESRINSRLAK